MGNAQEDEGQQLLESLSLEKQSQAGKAPSHAADPGMVPPWLLHSLGEATRDQSEEEAEEEGIHQPYPQGVSHGAACVAQQGKIPSPAAPGEHSPALPADAQQTQIWLLEQAQAPRA